MLIPVVERIRSEYEQLCTMSTAATEESSNDEGTVVGQESVNCCMLPSHKIVCESTCSNNDGLCDTTGSSSSSSNITTTHDTSDSLIIDEINSLLETSGVQVETLVNALKQQSTETSQLSSDLLPCLLDVLLFSDNPKESTNKVLDPSALPFCPQPPPPLQMINDLLYDVCDEMIAAVATNCDLKINSEIKSPTNSQAAAHHIVMPALNKQMQQPHTNVSHTNVSHTNVSHTNVSQINVSHTNVSHTRTHPIYDSGVVPRGAPQMNRIVRFPPSRPQQQLGYASAEQQRLVSQHHSLPSSRALWDNQQQSSNPSFDAKSLTLASPTALLSSAPEWQAQFYRTKLCPHYVADIPPSWNQNENIGNSAGFCVNQKNCRFAHSFAELRPLPDLRKTKLCASYTKKQTCTSRDCPFAHSPEELRTSSSVFYKVTLCNFYRSGKCWNGPNCRFAHGTEDLRGTSDSLKALNETSKDTDRVDTYSQAKMPVKWANLVRKNDWPAPCGKMVDSDTESKKGKKSIMWRPKKSLSDETHVVCEDNKNEVCDLINNGGSSSSSVCPSTTENTRSPTPMIICNSNPRIYDEEILRRIGEDPDNSKGFFDLLLAAEIDK